VEILLPPLAAAVGHGENDGNDREHPYGGTHYNMRYVERQQMRARAAPARQAPLLPKNETQRCYRPCPTWMTSTTR
jgi:hypothetical protein